MNEGRIFQLQGQIETLKQKRNTRIVTVPPAISFLLMAAGALLSAFWDNQFGYILGGLGFLGFAMSTLVQYIKNRRIKDIEDQIWQLTRELDDIQNS